MFCQRRFGLLPASVLFTQRIRVSEGFESSNGCPTFLETAKVAIRRTVTHKVNCGFARCLVAACSTCQVPRDSCESLRGLHYHFHRDRPSLSLFLSSLILDCPLYAQREQRSSLGAPEVSKSIKNNGGDAGCPIWTWPPRVPRFRPCGLD